MTIFSEAQTAHIELVVARHLRRPWQVHEVTDLRDLASHPAALLSDGSYAVFAKLSGAANALDQFESELAGLRLLTDRSGVRTPTAIGIVPTEDGALMILEALQAVEQRTSRHWRDIGRTLAQLHRIKSAQFGLETNCYFGPLYQDNRTVPTNDWPTFYAERRLWPSLMSAVDSGHMPSALIRQVEQLIRRLPELCGPAVTPTLLHGDAQKNNFISTDAGAVVVDPAAYYGHPEVDLAFVNYFEPVPDDVFDGYRELLPVDPGFAERRDLWRVYGYLAIVTLDNSPRYLGWLSEAVRKYL